MFLSWLLLASSAALFLTVDSQGLCVPANCSTPMGDLPPLCNCDENCTEFAEDCCGPQHLHERGGAEGQATNISLVCGSVSSNVTLSCPAGLLLSEETGIIISSIDTVVLVYNHQGHPLVVCIPRPLPLSPGIDIVSLISYSLSILGGVFILLTYSLFKELRTLSGIILMNLSVAIIMFNFCLTVLERILSLSEKVYVAVSLYLVCSEFAWVTLLLVQMTCILYQAWRLSRPSQVGSKWRLILVYMLIGWGLPLVALLGVIDILLLVLVLPLLFLIVVVNLCLLVIATVFLCLFSRHRRQVRTHSYYSDLIRLWVAFFAVTLRTPTFIFSIIFANIFVDDNRVSFAYMILSSAEVVIISLAFLCTKKVLKLYRDLLTCTSRNTKSSANPVLPVRSPDEGCGPLSPKKAHVVADVDMPTIGTTREGKTPTLAGDGETPTGEEETPTTLTGEGETPTGEGETPTGEGETPTGEGETPTGEGETPTGEGETPTGEGTGEEDTPTGEGERERPLQERGRHLQERERPLQERKRSLQERERPLQERERPPRERERPPGERERPL